MGKTTLIYSKYIIAVQGTSVEGDHIRIVTLNNVNYDVFVVTFLRGNFSDPFYSAEMRSNNKRKRSGNFKISLVRFSSIQSHDFCDAVASEKTRRHEKRTR